MSEAGPESGARRRRLATAAAVLAATAALGLAFFIRYAGPSFLSGPDSPHVIVNIPKGASASQVASLLKERGAIRSPGFFLVLARITGGPEDLRYGTYRLRPGSALDALRRIRAGDTYKVRVSIPEGWTSFQIAARLKESGVIPDEDAFAALVSSRNLEGRLFPETYFFEPGTGPERVVEEFFAQFRRVFSGELARGSEALGLSEIQTVALASIIEREAQVPEERPVISSVYHNRLKNGWPLEADPTVQYALSGGRFWKEKLTTNDLKFDSPYNTYRRRGLPPGPICNPGLGSLEAAAAPDETGFFFFVADSSGTHRFFRTLKEHSRFRAEKKRRERAARPLSGAKSH